jgi:hypothetical protein
MAKALVSEMRFLLLVTLLTPQDAGTSLLDLKGGFPDRPRGTAHRQRSGEARAPLVVQRDNAETDVLRARNALQSSGVG